MLYRFSHKTGAYAVTIEEERDDDVLVKVVQVIKHQKQGDLHNPTETEGVFFHTRKALSQYEKRFTPRSRLKPFEGDTMPYVASLQHAISQLEDKLRTKNDAHAQQSLHCLAQLKEDYRLQYKENFV